MDKNVKIQIGCDVKRIAIHLGMGVYMNISEGNSLSSAKFRWY